MLPADCPAWEYSGHPERQRLLDEVSRLLTGLVQGTLDTLRTSSDTRGIHRLLFERLAPPDHTYYAGHYRGESFRCLREYEVQVPGDPTVGYPALQVWAAMLLLSRDIEVGVAALDGAHQVPLAHLPRADRLLFVVALACRVFVQFLRVHPYANGNGHAARFVIWALLGRYGYWPRRWPIEPRPPDPPYTSLIEEYRKGNTEPLERFVLTCIDP